MDRIAFRRCAVEWERRALASELSARTDFEQASALAMRSFAAVFRLAAARKECQVWSVTKLPEAVPGSASMSSYGGETSLALAPSAGRPEEMLRGSATACLTGRRGQQDVNT